MLHRHCPTISEQSTSLLHLADLVLIPVRPSPADLWAVSETVTLVKEAGKAFLFVITQAKLQASITAQTIAALSQHGRLAQAFIADRVPNAVAMTGGRTAPELSAKSPAAEEIASPDVDAFLKSLSTAWKDGEARPMHRKQSGAKHWWRTKVDPFAGAWPLVDGWLMAEPAASAKVLMDRLATMFPEAYAGNAQLRTLQRRVKAWRAERAKEMILGRLRKSTVMPAEV